MNHDLLFNTHAPTGPLKPAQVQPVRTEEGGAESPAQQAFSSELDKQIGKQIPVTKTNEGDLVIVENKERPAPSVSEKAEILLDKNGKPLPTQLEITEQLIQQFLNDFTGESEQKAELTSIIERFVEKVFSEQNPTEDLKSQLNDLIVQLQQTGFVFKQEGEAVDGAVKETSKVLDKLHAIVAFVTTQETGKKTVLSQSEQVKSGHKTETGVERSQPELLKTQTVPQTTLTSITTRAKSEATVVPESKRPQTAPALVQELPKAEPEIGSKADKSSAVNELVKQVIAPKITPELSHPAAQEKTTSLSLNPVQTPSAAATVRPDILQALIPKEGVKKEAGNAIIKTVTAEQTINPMDKRLERITQLVELLKPQVSEKPSSQPRFEHFLTTQSSTPPSFFTQTGAIGKSEIPSLEIQPTLQNKAWGRVLSSRVIWMASEGVQQAALKLNPAHLGPVEVRLHVHNEQANITFIAQNATTREALEQALPRLRESFSENGLELTDAGVSDQASQQAKDEENERGNNNNIQDSDGMTTGREHAEQTQTAEQQTLELGVNVFA